MLVEYAEDEYGYRTYYIKAHVTDTEFRDALKREVEDNDPIVDAPLCRTYKRMARDFSEGHTIIIDADKGSRGAFPVTYCEEKQFAPTTRGLVNSAPTKSRT